MEFKDRVATYPNRRRIKIISQTPTEIVADIIREDCATTEGTAINAQIFNDFQTEINSAKSVADEAKTTAQTSDETSSQAKQVATNAQSVAQSALTNAEQATQTAINAQSVANAASIKAQEAYDHSISSAGTAISVGGQTVSSWDSDTKANQTDLTQEVSDRTTADSNLQTSINSLLTSLNQEITNRTNGDNSLTTKYNTLSSTVSGLTIDAISLGGSGYVKYTNGLLMHWKKISGTTGSVTFSPAFKDSSSYVVEISSVATNNAGMANGFAISSGSGGSYRTYGDGGFLFAIGAWK